MSKFTDRIKNGWNAFVNKDSPFDKRFDYDEYYMNSSANRPDRFHFSMGFDRTMVNSIYNRIALDVASCDIKHVKVDENGRYVEEVQGQLNSIFTISANLDQSARAFIQDAVMSMFDEGCVALVPIDTDVDPNDGSIVDIYSIRTGKILEWYPSMIKVRIYNERKGKYEEIFCNKSSVAIIENPFYSIMNERNSTLQRLVRKLNTLDKVDDQNSSGKLDLIIQLPYTIKTETRREQAEKRRKDIETQLTGSKYGIAYTDGTERITQLNRPVENTLMQQIEYLTKQLYSQLGLTEEIMAGTANEESMLNYYTRTIEPILSAMVEEMNRKFISVTGRTQGKRFMFFRDPFKLVTVENISKVADTFTRNEIMTSNEIRAILSMRPSTDPGANELRNKNLNRSKNETNEMPYEEYPEQNPFPVEENSY